MTAPSEALLPFLAKRIADMRYPLALRAPFYEWQQELRSTWRATLPPARIIRTEKLHSSEARRHLRFHYETGDSGEAMFLLPQGEGPHPAVLLMHDHGGFFDIGWQKMVESDEGSQHVAKHYEGRFLAEMFVAQGFAVLVCDALGWGSRFAGGYGEQQALAAQALQAGCSLAGLVAADDLAAFDWLSAHPKVDANRIFSCGYSFGGFRAWQLAALDQRVSGCAAFSWAGTRAGMLANGSTLLKGQSAFYTLHPDLAAFADFPDMAALAADRPFFLRTGSKDPHFPRQSAQLFLDTLTKAALEGMGDFAIVEIGHECPHFVQEQAIAFCSRHAFAQTRAL